MRHRKKNLHFGYEQRRRDDLRNLAASVILYEKVITTKDRAKDVKSIVDKMITLGKKKDLNSIRRLNKFFWDTNVSKKITQDLAVQLKDRNSGYTRVVKIGSRVGDGATKVMIELLVPHKEKIEKVAKPKVKKVDKAKKEIKPAEPKNWFERAKDFSKRIGRKDSKVTTRTTSK
jgi:large subunit ribosomal protein L17